MHLLNMPDLVLLLVLWETFFFLVQLQFCRPSSAFWVVISSFTPRGWSQTVFAGYLMEGNLADRQEAH